MKVIKTPGRTWALGQRPASTNNMNQDRSVLSCLQFQPSSFHCSCKNQLLVKTQNKCGNLTRYFQVEQTHKLVTAANDIELSFKAFGEFIERTAAFILCPMYQYDTGGCVCTRVCAHLHDPTGREFIWLQLLLQQLWVTVAEWTSWEEDMSMTGEMQTLDWRTW